MRWKEVVADYFSFTRRDRIAIITLLVVIIGVFLLPKTLSWFSYPKSTPADTAWFTALKKIQQKEAPGDLPYEKYDESKNMGYRYDRPVNKYPVSFKGELFYFDPNTLSSEGWEKLGLRVKTIRTIQNYLSRGAQFRKPEDLQKIYGLFPNEYERIAPYIRIEQPENENGFLEFEESLTGDKPAPKSYSARYTVIDINSADTADFISLPGIGSKLANRIVNFRDKLGGFYSVDQVGETYGLPDSTFQKIKQYLKLENNSIRKININTVTAEELRAHPYFKWSLANTIVAYRNEHGPFERVEDISKVLSVSKEVYHSILPYLTIQ